MRTETRPMVTSDYPRALGAILGSIQEINRPTNSNQVHQEGGDIARGMTRLTERT